MNKKITAVVLAAALTLSVTAFAGCNDKNSDTSSEGSKTAASDTKSSDSGKQERKDHIKGAGGCRKRDQCC